VQGTTNLVTGVTYTSASQPLIVSLGKGDSDNYASDQNTGRMTNYTFTVGSPAVSMTGGLTWNPNGIPNKMQISDGFNAGGTQTCKYGDPRVAQPFASFAKAGAGHLGERKQGGRPARAAKSWRFSQTSENGAMVLPVRCCLKACISSPLPSSHLVRPVRQTTRPVPEAW
jgi:hypothetical protein